MLPLKKYFTEGLIQFTILLSLMGVRVDVDSYLNAQLPPLREIILGQSSAYTQTQFHNWRNTLGGYDLHPKSVDLDYYFTARRLLNDVRGLDRLLVPSTELSAWLVHSGSSRETDGSVAASQPSLPLDNPSGVNEGAVAENSDRANGSSEQVEESLGAVGLPMSSDLTKEGPELLDQTPSFEECLRLLEETFPFAEDSEDMDVGESTGSFSEDTGSGNAELPVSHSQTPTTAINQDVSLHDATLPPCGQDFPPFFNANLDNVAVGSSPSPSLQPLASTNSTDFGSTFSSTNFTGLLFPQRINGTSNETCGPALADPLSGLLDAAMLDEISLLDLAMEEGFGPMETSQIEQELESDSGLSLDSSQSPVSPSSSESSSSSSPSTSSSSSLSLSEEGAVGYSSNSEEDSEEGEGEGAVGGYQPQFSKFCRMSYQNPSSFHSLPYLNQINHNHTYNLPTGASVSGPHSPPGQKAGFKETHCSHIDLQVGRDERRARALKIPFSNDKIINLPVDEFNELLNKYHLTETQLTLIRDIRRRGKNKLAAQNCRKRKLDTILNLDQDVEQLKRQKARLLKEKVDFVKSLRQMKQKLQGLYQEVFGRLRDEEGRPYCPSQYTLQYANNGSMLVMPHTLIAQQGKPDKKKGSKKK
ncbi:endoplasmic reticulum membrane sensor NFE2L1b isoform X4 [Rhinoraja longicauda]